MHSRIFQVSRKPITEDNYMIEADFYDHWFTREIADYVDSDTYRDDDISWLAKLDGIEVCVDDNGNDYFIVVDKELYFKNQYNVFIKAINNLTRCTLSEFSTGINEMYYLNSFYNDKFGIYIQDDDRFGLVTLDEFMRNVENGDKLYIGCTLDYHW